MRKYNGQIQEQENWETKYGLSKRDGTFTSLGRYEDVYNVGQDVYVISPYYTGMDYWMEGTAQEVLEFTAIT